MLIILKNDYGNNVSHKKSDNDYYGDNDNAVNFLGIFISTNFFFLWFLPSLLLPEHPKSVWCLKFFCTGLSFIFSCFRSTFHSNYENRKINVKVILKKCTAADLFIYLNSIILRKWFFLRSFLCALSPWNFWGNIFTGILSDWYPTHMCILNFRMICRKESMPNLWTCQPVSEKLRLSLLDVLSSTNQS